MWEDNRDEYFADFLTAACSAAPPGLAEMDKWDSASMLTTVMSHAIDLPACHGISVLPSGRLPLSLTNPDGSLTDGTLALHRAHQTRSLACHPFKSQTAGKTMNRPTSGMLLLLLY